MNFTLLITIVTKRSVGLNSPSLLVTAKKTFFSSSFNIDFLERSKIGTARLRVIGSHVRAWGSISAPMHGQKGPQKGCCIVRKKQKPWKKLHS